MLVVAAIVIWISGQTQQAHSADSTSKRPIEISARLEGGVPALTANSPSPSAKITTASD